MSEEILTGDIPDEEEEGEFIGGFDDDGEGIFGDVPEMPETTDPFDAIGPSHDAVAEQQSFTPTISTQPVAQQPSFVVQAPRISGHVTEINIQNCQLCRQVFLNRQLLLDHMRTFHNIDTGHVLAVARPAAAAGNAPSSGPTRVQQLPINNIGQPRIIRLNPAGTTSTLGFLAGPRGTGAAPTTATTFRLQTVASAGQSIRTALPVRNQPLVGIRQLVANQLNLQQAQGMKPRLVLNQPNATISTASNKFIPPHLQTILEASKSSVQTAKPPSRLYVPIAPKGPTVLAKELSFENAGGSGVPERPKSKYILASESGVGFNCKECWRHFNTIVEAESHVTEAHVANQKCKFCGETFLDLDFLQAHVEVVHNGKIPHSLATAEDTDEPLEARTKPVSPEIITLSDDDEAVAGCISSIVEPRESVSMAAASIVSQPPAPACDTTSYLKYVSLNGYLNQQQLEFAGKMIESEGTFARCKICNNKYSSMFHAKSHVRHTHLREYHKCAVCQKRFKSKLKRDQHRIEAHPEVPPGNVSTKNPQNNSRPSSSNRLDTSNGSLSQEEIKSFTVGVFNTPIFVNSAVQSLITPSSKTNGSYECGRCQKEFTAQKYCVQHVRAVHFSKTNLCSRCLCFYEDVLVHRLCCTGDSTGSTQFLPSVESLVSVMEDIVVAGNHNGKEVYSCRLCNKRYDRRYFTESHVWLDHCRSFWTTLAGVETTEAVYEKFIQHQKNVHPNQPVVQHFIAGQAVASPAVPDNPRPNTGSGPASVLIPEVSWQEDDFDPSLQCEVEFADEESNNALLSEDIDRLAITDVTSVPPATVRNQLGKELTQTELLNWSRRALKFIREKGGKFVCIICQEVSKLRTSLVDHVRETHLLKRQASGSGEIQQPIASDNGPDRRMCTICSEEFQTVIERQNHESFCATTSQYVDTPGVRSIVPQPPTVVQSRKTSSLDRAMKFTKQEGREYSCTVCSVRATKMYRLLAHIISIHFGEDPTETDKNKCGGCGRQFSTPGAKAMHVKHCKVTKLKKMNQSLKQVNAINHPPPVVKPTEPTKATAVVEPQRSRYGRNLSRRDDPVATAKPGQERSKMLVPDTWNSDLTGLLPYKVGEFKFLRCSACEVLIPDTQNGDDHLRKFHGGNQLYNCTKCEAVFLTGTVRDEHQIGCQQELPEEEPEAPSSPNIGYEDDGSAQDYSPPPVSPSPSPPEVHEPAKSPLKKVTPKKKSSPSSTKKTKAAAKSIVKKYTATKLTRNAKIFAASKLQKTVDNTRKSSISFAGSRAARSLRHRMLSSKNDAAIAKLMKQVKVGRLQRYRCGKCASKPPGKKSPIELHVRVAHFKERPLECRMCQKSFSAWSTFSKHFLRNHPDGTGNDEPEESDENLSPPESKKICIEKFACKLCKETCNDIPMVRFHLVSEHSGELQAMGKADKLFIDAEKVAESLSVPVRVEMTPDGSEQQKTKTTSAPKQKLKSGSARSKSKSSKLTTSREDDSETDWRTLPLPEVFADESALLKSIQSSEASTPPCTVRMELLRVKHPMPEFMLAAARRIIEKVLPHLYVCQLCHKQFQTSSGSGKHARRIHFGEFIECSHCQKTFNEEHKLISHESSCPKKKKVSSSTKAKPSTKSRSPAPAVQSYASFPGGIDPDLLSSIMTLAPISRPGPASSKKKLKKKKKKKGHQAAIKFNFAKKPTADLS